MRLPGTIAPLPGGSVTRTSDREPPGAGRDPRAAAIWRAVERWYESGTSPAIAICLRHRGEVVLDRSIGIANHAGGRANVASPDTLFHIFSASKMVVGVLVHQACERGEIELDAPVASYVPEFAASGKAAITIRDVLAHRAGVPGLGEPTTHALLLDRKRIVDWLCRTPPRLRPGRLAYHALTGGYILAEVLERVTGKHLSEILERDVASPLGLDHFRYGANASAKQRVADNYFTGLAVPPPLSWFIEKALGISAEEATRLSNDQEYCDAIVPAGNLVTSANQACIFMEALRCGGAYGGARILEERTLDRALESHSHLELDHTLVLPVHYGLGFMLGGRAISPYGVRTPAAFGHLGFMQVLLWADPERELSGALLTSGKTFLSTGLLHFAALMQTIAMRFPRKRE